MAQTFVDVAKQFVEFYYNTFDGPDRKNLAPLYRDHSMLTFESDSFLGTKNIVEKLAGLQFQKVKHRVSTLDAQPTFEDKGIMIHVTGQLITDDESRPLNYAQAFLLVQDAAGTWFVYNDFFKLVLG